MVGHELTGGGESRYHGYMEPSSSESQERSSHDAYERPAPAPDWMSSYGKQMYETTRTNGNLEDSQLSDSNDSSPEEEAAKSPLSKESHESSDHLKKIANEVNKTPSPSMVASYADQVRMAANFLEMAVQPKRKPKEGEKLTPQEDPYAELRAKLLEKKVFSRAAELTKLIQQAHDLPGELEGEQREGYVSERKRAVMVHANDIAKLAQDIADFYEEEPLAPEITDPYRNIRSFEELMIKFAAVQIEEKYKPGGEFSLIDVEEYEDEFGRKLTKETAHPENFLRWTRERIWFYHDFDPMLPIELFKNIYIVAGYHQVNVYQMTVDFPIYFAHREPTFGKLMVTQNDLLHAEEKGIFQFKNGIELRTAQPGTEIGRYEYTDKNGEKKTAIVKRTLDNVGREEAFGVFDEKGNRLQGELADRDLWNPKEDTQFQQIQEQVLYEMWLMTHNHNNDVHYRQKGMPSEKPLNETMAELYSQNIFTRTRKRIYKIFNMASTTRIEDQPTEALLQMKGELKGQGSLGKAFQRSLAAYYHIGESQAKQKKWKIEGANPFREILRGKDGFEGADLYYKSLVSLMLEKKFGFLKYDKDHPENSKLATEFLHALNDTRIRRPNGSYRGRYEWEKADLVDLLFSDGDSLESVLGRRNISREAIQDAIEVMEKRYGSNGESKNDARMSELDAILKLSGVQKVRNLFESLEKSGVEKFRGSKEFEAFIASMNKGEPDYEVFAVDMFTKLAFPSEFNPGINPFENIRYSLEARDLVRDAMRRVLVTTEHLDEFEAKYAEEWAYTMTYHTGISGRNDTQGIGHDAWAKVLNTEFYRLRQTSGGNYPGNLDNLYGIHRLGVDFWEGTKVQPDGSNSFSKTLYEELTGLERHGDSFIYNINKDMEGYEFAGNAMRQFYADHVYHAIDLFVDLTQQKPDFNIDKLIKTDNFHRLVWNTEEMEKMINSTWKHMRYGFDNNGILYDSYVGGWWYDERMGEGGKVSRSPHYGINTIRELMFSKQIRDMNMYERQDVSSWDGTDKNSDVYRMKMGRNVFAFIIAAQLKEHTRRSGHYRVYSAEEIEVITEAFLMYAARVMKGMDGEAIVLSGFFNPEEMMRILATGHSILWWLYMKELGFSMSGGLFFGFLEAILFALKQGGTAVKI